MESKAKTPGVVLLMGPTASGKSTLAMKVAGLRDVEIVNCDSQQIYRYLDIGTAKPGPEDRARCPHHLFDIVDPREGFNAGAYQEAADRAIEEIVQRGRIPLVVGGTGLYARALLKGIAEIPPIPEEVREEVRRALAELGPNQIHENLAQVDPESARRLHPNDSQRVTRALEVFRATGRSITWFQEQHGFNQQRYQASIFGMSWPRDLLDQRIRTRLGGMVDQGFLEEAGRLLAMGYPEDTPAFQALGYRELFQVLAGTLSLRRAVERIRLIHRQYAKRQMTWFNKMEGLTWIEGTDPDQALARVLDAVDSCR